MRCREPSGAVIWSLVVTVALLAVAAVLVARTRRRVRPRPMPLSVSGERVTTEIADEPEPRVRQFLTTGSYPLPDVEHDGAHLKREALTRLEQAEVASDLASLDVFLADVRDALGADEAVFWRWSRQRDRLTPSAWSAAGTPRPQHFDMQAWGTLVRKAAEERQLMFDADARVAVIRLAAAPIELGDRLIGVLSVSRAEGLDRGRETIRSWLPRHATQVGRLIQLFELRREYSRHMRQNQALLRAAGKVQGGGAHKSPESLFGAICETAAEVSSATDAAVVRWRAEDGRGWVYFATPGFKVKKDSLPLSLGLDSLVARACADGQSLRLEDVATLAPPVSLFVSGDNGWAKGALSILPLTLSDRVMGAIVIASDRPKSLSVEEGNNVALLGALAAASLEMVWEIEEVNRRARTDALTGLPNRGAFDDNLDTLLRHADRFGRPLSLILADVDHFKQVNDTWGHEAGDAVLRYIARALLATKRGVDVCARFGGEELAILLPETDLKGSLQVAERMREAVAAHPVRAGGTEIPVTISLGVACYPEGVLTREALFAAADRALYDAKSAGRNRVKAAVPKPVGSVT